MRVLFSGIFGLRGLCSYASGPMTSRSIVYYGDKRDSHGPKTEHYPAGVHTTWSFKYFANALRLMKFDALEFLYCQGNNILKCDPLFHTIIGYSEQLLCHQMSDVVLRRAENLFNKGMGPTGGDPKQEKRRRYDPSKTLQGMLLLAAAHKLIAEGHLCLQGADIGALGHSILFNQATKSKIRENWDNYLRALRREQVKCLMAPTKEQIWRGEKPYSSIPAIWDDETKEMLNLRLQKVEKGLVENKVLDKVPVYGKKALKRIQDHNPPSPQPFFTTLEMGNSISEYLIDEPVEEEEVEAAPLPRVAQRILRASREREGSRRS